MKRTIVFLIALLVIASISLAQTPSNVTKGVPLNTSDGAMTGFVALATPTLTLSDVAQKIGTVPPNTIAVIVTASGGINYGDSSVDTSTGGAFPTMATTTSKRFPIYPGTTQPNIWLINTASGTPSVARLTAEVQR